MYTKFQKLYEACKEKNLSERRRIASIFLVQSRIQKLITPPVAHLFLKLKISADTITIVSFLFILIGCYYFIKGDFFIGSLSWWIFVVLDSLDGDLARITPKKTKYGNTLDSFGADIFYFIFPFIISYYLYNYTNYNFILYSNSDILLVALILSFSLTGYRIIGLKRYILSLEDKKKNLKKKKFSSQILFLKRFYDIYDNEIIRGNFFSEPGIILNIFIISLIGNNILLFYYLIILSIYCFIRFLKSVLATYISFKGMK